MMARVETVFGQVKETEPEPRMLSRKTTEFKKLAPKFAHKQRVSIRNDRFGKTVESENFHHKSTS